MSEIGEGLQDLPSGAVDIGNGTYICKVFDNAGKWIAIDEFHLNPTTGKLCGGWVSFDVESDYLTPQSVKWTVESYEPLTLSPSLLCRACGHHGWIRNGRWEDC